MSASLATRPYDYTPVYPPDYQEPLRLQDDSTMPYGNGSAWGLAFGLLVFGFGVSAGWLLVLCAKALGLFASLGWQ